AGRLVLWAWAAERLATREPAVSLAACGLLGALWLIGCLTWRVLEVPDVGEPFDVESFRASLPSPAENEAGDLIVKALGDVNVQHKKVGPLSGTGNGKESIEKSVLRQGWASLRPRFETSLNDLFEESWKDKLEKGVAKPLGVVVNPREVRKESLPGIVQACRFTALLYRLRALQLQAEGKHRAALGRLNVLLGLSRHLRNKTITASFLLGLEVENEALSGLEDWARGACDDHELMRDARKALKTHEHELPPLDDVLKADYLGAYPRLRDHYEALTTPRGLYGPPVAAMQGNMFLLSQETPWEQARTKRLINGQYAAVFADRPSDPSLEWRQPWLRVTGPGDWAQSRRMAKRALDRVRAVRLALD
ncbi:MAG: hypothetical protein HYS12_29105, partial [Planctomycetes bacterium]|nr:hypothetical protein [Planctomycetota bacterium]